MIHLSLFIQMKKQLHDIYIYTWYMEITTSVFLYGICKTPKKEIENHPFKIFCLSLKWMPLMQTVHE
jgi:hypothetical protein